MFVSDESKFLSRLGTAAKAARLKWKQTLCVHDDLWRFLPGHTYLECVKCKRRTPGWDVRDIRAPRVLHEGYDESKFAGSSK